MKSIPLLLTIFFLRIRTIKMKKKCNCSVQRFIIRDSLESSGVLNMKRTSKFNFKRICLCNTVICQENKYQLQSIKMINIFVSLMAYINGFICLGWLSKSNATLMILCFQFWRSFRNLSTYDNSADLYLHFNQRMLGHYI